MGLIYIFLIESIRLTLTHPHWFSAACAAAIGHRYHFFLYQKDKSSESKVKSRQASNRFKRVLEAAKLAYAIKQKSLNRNLTLGVTAV